MRLIHPAVARLFERAFTYDEAWHQQLARRGLSTRGTLGPAQLVLFFIVFGAVIAPVLLLIQLSIAYKSEVLFIIAVALSFALIIIPVLFGIFLAMSGIRNYFQRKKMIESYAKSHKNRSL